jgi:hypothetical protein
MRFLLIALVLLVPSPASAHAVTLAYIDIRPATEASPTLLTVAIHPHQALLLVGAPHDAQSGEEEPFAEQIPLLHTHADVVAAYLKEHVTITATGTPCAWEPTRVEIPDTELGALADGVAMTAPLVCEGGMESLEIASTLFIGAFQGQQTVVRLETPEGFAERLLLDAQHTTGTLALSPKAIADVLPPPEPSRPNASTLLQIAGWTVFFIMIGTVSVVAYRTNIASPKE